MNSYLTSMIKEINQIIQPYIQKKDGFNDHIIDVIDYAFNPGGKRLRPLFMALTYEMLTGKSNLEQIAPFMSAIEMIHTYSLIHDDLPALDNDDLRRGKPSVHVAYSEDMAILAGDALLNLAYEVLFDELYRHPDQANIMAARIISSCAGLQGMVGGQVVDMRNDHSGIDEEILNYIHINKTAKLLIASMVSIGYITKSEAAVIKQLEEIGKILGLAFQIQDDVLDQVSSEAELGKPIHSDERNDKTTYVSIHGLDDSIKTYESLFETCMAQLEELNPIHSNHLIALIKYIKNRRN